MLILDSHNRYQETIDALNKGENVVQEPWLDELYEDWAEANPNHELFDLDMQTEHFVEHVRQEYVERSSELGGEDMERLAKRGQAVLATKDKGETWEVMSPSEAKRLDFTEYEFLSPSLVTSTNDISDLVEQQQVIAAVAVLRQHQFLVYGAEVKNGQLVIQALHPKGEFNIKVDLDAESSEPMTFEISDANRPELSKEYLASQLPEDFGMPVDEMTLSGQRQKDILLQQWLKDRNAQSSAAALDATLRTIATAEAARLANAANMLNRAGDLEESKNIHAREQEALAEERIQAIQQQRAAQAQRNSELGAFNERQQRVKQQEKKQEQKQRIQEERSQKRKQQRRRVGGAALAGGGLIAGGLGTGAFLTTVLELTYKGSFIAAIFLFNS